MNRMEENGQAGFYVPADEEAEYTEFKRARKEAEIKLIFKKLVADASRREADGVTVKKTCDFVKKNSLCGVLVSPIRAACAKRQLAGGGAVLCLAGGTGETLPAVKKCEIKKLFRLGVKEFRFVPCYSAIEGRDLSYMKRELGKIRRAVRDAALVLALDDRSVDEEGISIGVRAACESGFNGVCVRGETPLLLRAVEEGGGKVFADCTGVENAEQLRALLRLGANRLATPCPEQIVGEIRALA